MVFTLDIEIKFALMIIFSTIAAFLFYKRNEKQKKLLLETTILLEILVFLAMLFLFLPFMLINMIISMIFLIFAALVFFNPKILIQRP